MDYHHQQWRQRPPIQQQPNASNACPSCSFPHFPFCPPNPYHFHHYPRPPPPPPPPLSDGGDRSHKRPRVDDDDERRLRLIRDHGASSEGYNHRPDPNWPYANGNGVYGHHSPGGGYMPRLGVGNNHPQGSPRFYGVPPPSPPPPPPPPPSLFPVFHEAAQSPAQPYFHSKSFMHSSTGFANQDSQGVHGMLPREYFGEDQCLPPPKNLSSDNPTVVDASQLFNKPHRSIRPDNFVIILRGLPGSGKSYLAKMLRDIEVENGGAAPRIHSMDDYFMTEVEKVEEGDNSKPSVRGKKPVVKKVMEYCYEPEMEEAYRSSMLKAFKKTLEEGAFTFIIVDDRNLRKADFAQFWAIAKSSGYEVYILEASYKDPAGCAARNVHGFSLDDIQKMAEQWEEAPYFHLRLDAKSLCSGDDLKKSGILEVDMDMEEEDTDEIPSKLNGQNVRNSLATPVEDDTPDDSSKGGKIWDDGEEENAPEVKDLGRSKWSNELYEDETEQSEPTKGKIYARSGLIPAYGKEAKSVRWSDKGGGNTGFSISAAKKANTLSLVIGPGAGYSLKSNPLPEKNYFVPSKSSAGGTKNQSVFQEQLRAECESFKAAFSTRQVRIGLDSDDE